jgi:hypothetical protein
MQHVDEGTLHALLDGELPAEEAAQIRLHFATCPSCSTRLDEARQLLAETERLVSALELPDAGARSTRTHAAPESRAAGAADRTVADVLVPPSPSTPLPPLDPVVLIPENPTPREVRRSRLRYMAWAATVLVAVGAGYVGMTQRSLMQARSADAHVDLSPDEFRTVEGAPARSDSAATLALTDSEVPVSANQRSALAKDTRAAAPPAAPAKTEVRPPAATEPRAQARPAPTERAETTGGPEAKEKVSEAPAPAAAPEPARAAAPPTAEPAATARQDAAESVRANRQTAAQATAELDRRRTRERAAEATAALERERAERQAAEERERQLAADRAAATAAPAPAAAAAPGPTRIGLDEAARQLGGPLHAIDGLSRQSVTLLPGNSVEGADPERAVVRAVYTDRSGVPLYLDQQMARPGQGPATPQTGRAGRQIWVKDGVLLILHGGNLTADSLKSLARRVR